MKWRTIKSSTTLEKAFEEMRSSGEFHLGMGDIRLSIKDQKELCNLVRLQMFTFSTRCEQMLSFVKWYAATKDASLKGKEQSLLEEWSESK